MRKLNKYKNKENNLMSYWDIFLVGTPPMKKIKKSKNVKQLFWWMFKICFWWAFFLVKFFCSKIDKYSTTDLPILNPTHKITPTNYIRCMIIVYFFSRFAVCFGNTFLSWYGQIFVLNINVYHGQIELLIYILNHLRLHILYNYKYLKQS